MTEAIKLIFGFFSDLISLLDTTIFELYGFNVSLWTVIFSFIVTGIVANVWWKGAKG